MKLLRSVYLFRWWWTD